MANINTAAVVITVVKDSLSFEFNEAAITRFGKGSGLRLNIGTAYLLSNKADREVLVSFFGKGAVRRGLMVLGKSTSANDKDRAAAKVLAESLRTVTAKQVVKAAKAKATRKVATKVAA
jgi:hypothetical protein